MEDAQGSRPTIAPFPRTFFIYDRNLCKTEADPPDKMVVYIHPAETSQQTQSYLAGICSAMEEYLGNFTTSPPRILSLERDKLAMRKIGTLTMVLSGHIGQPDSSLYADLDTIYSAFCFLFGSFQTVLHSVKGDEDRFVEEMRDYCKELAPFVRRLHPFGGAFATLPMTQLPPHCNRFFLMASEVLNLVRSEKDNLGGMVMFDNTVLCSHFNETISSHILTRVESRYQASRAAGAAAAALPQSVAGSVLGGGVAPIVSTTAGAASVDYLSEIMVVCVDGRTIEELKAGRPPMPEPEPVSIDSGGEMVPMAYVPDCELPGPNGEPPAVASPADGEFIGLYILVLNRITLAVLMNYSAIYNERHATVTRSLATNKLVSLEAKLLRALKVASTNESRPPPFQHLLYDRSTTALKGSGIDASAGDADPRFRHAARVEHDLFSTTSAELIVLRDTQTTVLGRRVFDREIIFTPHTASQAAPQLAQANAMGSSGTTQPGIGVQRPSFAPAEFRDSEETARQGLQEIGIHLL